MMAGWLDKINRALDDLHTVASVANGSASPGGNATGTGGSNIPAYPLEASATVVLNSSGNGTAKITPGQPDPGGGVGVGRNSGLTWDISAVAVNVAPLPGNSVPVNQAQCSAYLSYGIQSAGPADFQSSASTGSTGATDSLSATIRPGDWITAVWTGG